MTVDVDTLLNEMGFDANETALTRRQVEILALREHDLSQAAIAEILGTSRANVSSIETSARDNIEKARETVAFAETLFAPVHVQIPAGTPVFDIPELVYDACDSADIHVAYAAPDLLKHITDSAEDNVGDRQVLKPIHVGVTREGTVHIRHSCRR